jgi:hypothetical protein
LAKEDSESIDKVIRAMALLVSEILSVRSLDEGIDEKAQLYWYLRTVGIFSLAAGSFLLFIAVVR